LLAVTAWAEPPTFRLVSCFSPGRRFRCQLRDVAGVPTLRDSWAFYFDRAVFST
jgi:hypothetical protein